MKMIYKFIGRYSEFASKFSKVISSVICDDVPGSAISYFSRPVKQSWVMSTAPLSYCAVFCSAVHKAGHTNSRDLSP